MRAVIVNEYGGTPVVAEIPTPQPGPSQVLIKMRASGVNPMDSWLASGAQRSEAATFPMVLGADGAGIVEMIGEGATRFSPGDTVFGQLWRAAPLVEAGTHAEYVAVSADGPLARVPDGLDLVVAAALPTAGMSGLSLVEMLTPLAGKTVLIVGAGRYGKHTRTASMCSWMWPAMRTASRRLPRLSAAAGPQSRPSTSPMSRR
jgi:NADPH:quinone reductase-like Zn-dependent oxidoreductase